MPEASPGEKLAETPLGRPLTASATLPENPPEPVTVMLLVAVSPCTTDTLAGEADNVKLGTLLTVTVAVPVAVPKLLSPE